MSKTKKTLTTLIMTGMVLTMIPFNAFASTGVTTDRIEGADRFGTAIKVADKFVSADTAILAPSANANLVDALASAPLAGKTSPILLTDNNTLTEATKAELIKLKVTKVYVVGAISQAVFEEVKAMPGVTAIQLKGANRIETASLISSKLIKPAGTFVVGFDGLADALSVSSYASAHNYSILVANPDGNLPDGTKVAGKAYTVGGETRVNPIAGVESLAGSDRYATNKVVLEKLAYNYDKTYVASGIEGHLVDSLVASSLAGLTDSPIVLTNNDVGGDSASSYANTKLPANAIVYALGGTGVVFDASVAKVVGVVEVDQQIAIVANAETAVKAYESAPISTLDEIATAEALKSQTETEVALVTNVTTKDVFMARISARTDAITAKKAELNAPVITNVSMISSNIDKTKAVNGDIITLTFTSNTSVAKLGNFKINGSNPDTFTNVGNVYTATHLVDNGDVVGNIASFQINVKNEAGIYSQTVEATTDGSLVSISPIINASLTVDKGLILNLDFNETVDLATKSNVQLSYFTKNTDGTLTPIQNTIASAPLVKDKTWDGYLYGVADGAHYSKGTLNVAEDINVISANAKLSTMVRNGYHSNGDMNYVAIDWTTPATYVVQIVVTDNAGNASVVKQVEATVQ